MEKKDFCFLFKPGDYLRDTQCLSEKSQVAYDRIMCEHMRNITITQKQLDFFTKRLNQAESEELLHVLTKVNGGYQIEWVAISINNRKSYSESRRKNRLSKHMTYDEHMKTYVNHMENENENENINTTKDSIKTEACVNTEGGAGGVDNSAIEAPLSQLDDRTTQTMHMRPIVENNMVYVRNLRHAEFLHSGPPEWINYDFLSGKVWGQLKNNLATFDEDVAIRAATEYREYCSRLGTKNTFIKRPQNFLSDGYWRIDWKAELEREKESNRNYVETEEEALDRLAKQHEVVE